MRYILRFEQTKEYEVKEFVPQKNDSIVIHYKERIIRLLVETRTFLPHQGMCICFCALVTETGIMKNDL